MEGLSFKIFELYFNQYGTAEDCNVLIDDFKSDLTVDISMDGLVCECKVPASKFINCVFAVAVITLNG